MKRNFLRLSLVLFVLCFTILSSSYAQTEKDTLKMFTGTWLMSYIDGGHMKIPIPETDANNSWIKINEDGTHSFLENGKEYKGTWTYDNKKKSITTNDKDGVITNKVSTITTEEMVLVMKQDGQDVKVGWKRKPKK